MIYLIFCAIYKAMNADNARMFGIWFDDKLLEVYATNDVVKSVCNYKLIPTVVHLP